MLKKEKNNKKKEIIGCIADDFTGAADVCSLLVESGARCIFLNDIPSKKIETSDVDVVVIALKIRNINATKAIKKVEEAIDYLESLKVTRIFSKYCSTFDSTDKGNIGPILDYLMERYGQKYIVASPAFPENNREVFNGYLFADKKLLSEGSMRTHPITPMLDSNLVRLLEKQSKYKAYNINYNQLYEENSNVKNLINDYSNKSENFYIIPDYFNNNHGNIIMKHFSDTKVMSGSSQLINDWYKVIFKDADKFEYDKSNNKKSKVIIFSGSLSDKTNEQIKEFINMGGEAIEVKVEDLSKGAEYYKEKILNSDNNLMLYSSRNKLEEDSKQSLSYERFFAELAKFSYENGVNKIIAAGGETSGSVIQALPFGEYKAIYNIDKGIPVLEPKENKDFRIVLKSGNFGSNKFFEQSIELMN